MNKSAAYSILNPHPMLTRYDAEGRICVLLRTDDASYLNVADMRDLEAQGLITIHDVTQTGIQNVYGRTSVTYTIN